jgi:hypothetical protein
MLAKRKKVLVENKELLIKRETEFKKKLWLCDETYWETMDKLITTDNQLLKIKKELDKTEEELRLCWKTIGEIFTREHELLKTKKKLNKMSYWIQRIRIMQSYNPELYAELYLGK